MAKELRPWHEANPALYEEVRRLVRSHFPTLRVEIENGVVYIRGSLPLHEPETLREITRYRVEIALPRDHPKSVPLVCETGGRLPVTPDRHFSFDGSACLFVAEERWKHYPEGATILDFINGPVRQFFLGQAHFDLTGQWPFGERAHGAAGIIEYYFEELGTTDVKTVVRFLEYLAKGEAKGHWECFCGSSKRMRHCHSEKLKELRAKIPTQVAQSSLAQIKAEIVQFLKDRERTGDD
jgi:hypothetical protein